MCFEGDDCECEPRTHMLVLQARLALNLFFQTPSVSTTKQVQTQPGLHDLVSRNQTKTKENGFSEKIYHFLDCPAQSQTNL